MKELLTRELWEKGIFRGTTWRGVPCLKIPSDLFVYQQIIVATLPDYIIEAGTFKGGTALFMADVCSLVEHGKVITIDIVGQVESVVRDHPLIERLIGSSTDVETAEHLVGCVGPNSRCMVVLDSAHSREQVAEELCLYYHFVGAGCYLIVEDGYFDTIVHDPSYPYNGGPVPAIQDFLANHPEFERDKELEERYLATFNPWGYLRRLR